jgi:hypothetical protein
MLSVFPRFPVVVDLYSMRVLSVIFALLTLWTAWVGTRRTFGDGAALTIVAVLAVHPQFAVVSTAAGPDSWVNLAGGVVYWQALRALERPNFIPPMIAAWIAAAGASLADRMGIALLVSALVVSLYILVRRRGIRPADIAVAVAAAALVALWVRMDADMWRGISATLGDAWAPVPAARSQEYLASFHSELFTSWWLSLGWGRYLPPGWWVMAALGVSAAGVVGLLRSVVERRVSDAVAMAILMVAVQLAAVYWVYLRPGVGAHGRHLFPVLIPSLVLLCAGWDRLFGPALGSRARVVLVVAVAALDAAGWLALAIPVYGRG